MSKGYWVGAYRSVSDPEKLAAYGAGYAEALAAYRGEDYQRALQVLDGAAERDVRIVEGLG